MLYQEKTDLIINAFYKVYNKLGYGFAERVFHNAFVVELRSVGFNIKSEQSIFKVGILENKFLIGSFILGVLVQTIVVIIPTLANIFKLVPLNQTQWIITILISILPIPIMEIQKKVNEIKFGKIIYTEKQKI